jgi:perosamine synthetase
MNEHALLQSLLIGKGASVRDVLTALNKSGLRVVFVTEDSGRVIGAISDGDVRRSLLNGRSLADLASAVMNPDFVRLSDDIPDDEARLHLGDRISVIPLVDRLGRATRVVSQKDPSFIPAAEPDLDGNELAYVVDCMKSGWISSQGTYVSAFENAFARYVGVEHAVSVSNGTVALQLALVALGIGQGDEVLVPDLTFAATLNAVLHVGATPVVVDVHPRNLTIDPDAVQAAITNRSRAVIPVHLYGQMCDMPALAEIVRANGLHMVEDAAQALGSRHGGLHAGTFGHAGTFSFFANKLITTGEGGMVVFADREVAHRARMLRDHGMDPQQRYWHLEPGFNFRLTNLQAAVGLAQIERIDELLGAKLKMAEAYRTRLADLIDILLLPEAIPNSLHSFWNFVVLLRDDYADNVATRLIQFMRDRRIDARRIFFPMHIMPPYQNCPRLGDCKNSVSAARRGIAFPASPKLAEAQITDICNTFRQGIEMLDVERLSCGNCA